MKKQIAPVLIVLSVAMFFVVSGGLQSQKKNLVIEVLSSNEPVKIDSFKIGSTTINSEEKFASSDDWIKELYVNVKNSFGKNVTYIDVGVFVARPAGQEQIPMFHYSISQGNKMSALKRINSGLEFKSSDSNDNILSVALPDNEYNEIRDSLDQLGYPLKIEKLQIQIEEVIFDDGTMWSIGSWYKYNSDEPQKPIRIKENEGSENKIATLSSTEERVECGSPFYLYKVCSRIESTVCIAKFVNLFESEPKTHKLMEDMNDVIFNSQMVKEVNLVAQTLLLI